MSFCSLSKKKTSYRTHCTFSSCTEHQKSHFHSRPSFRPPLDGGRGWNPGRFAPRYLAKEPGGVWQEFSVSRLHSDFAVLAYRVETKTELVSRHHSAHSDTLVPPSHPSAHTGHSSAHVKQVSLGFAFKVPVYCPGVVPKHHAPYNTPFIRSFFFLTHFFCFLNKSSSSFRFFIRDFVPSFSVSTTSQSAFIPGLTEAQDMVQNGMLWLEHTPPPFLAGPGQPGSWSGHNISPAWSYGPLRGASSCAGLGGPTWRNTWRKRKGEKQGQAGATEAIKRHER